MTYDSMMTYLSTLTPEQRDSLRGRSRFTPIQVIALSLRRASQLPEEILREIMRHVMTIRRRTMNRRIRTNNFAYATANYTDAMRAAGIYTEWTRHFRGWSGPLTLIRIPTLPHTVMFPDTGH
jgi:hypothetical protein